LAVRAQQAAKPLVIGVVAGRGSQTSRGVQLAASRFNARGVTTTPDGQNYTVVVEERDANTPAEVATAINDLKSKGAIAIFGPDIDELAQASQNSLLAAGLPVFIAASSPNVQTTGAVYRTRATDTRQLAALAQFITADLAKAKIAIFQGDTFVAPRVTLFTTSLTQLGKAPATTVLQVQGGALKDSARVLLQAAPDMVVAFGAADQVAQLLAELRAQNYSGAFSYPDAAERSFITALPVQYRAQIVGVSNWTYSLPTGVSGEFVRDYVALFGEVPTGKSAAAYDAAGALIIAASRNGIAAGALVRGLLALPKVESIQGNFNAGLGTNELSADAYVFETGEYGSPLVKARYNEAGKTTIAAGPLPTLAPTVVVVPTVVPTSTPDGVTAQPKNSVINVRAGPGTNYDRIGQLRQTDVVQVIGVSPNLDWIVIAFAGGRGWLQGNLVNINGNLSSVPIIEPPPSPTPPPATNTPLPPTAAPFPDITPISVVLNPPQPKVNQPFIASVVLQNKGTVNAGQFAVAATWLPGNVYSAIVVDGLAAGATTTVNLQVSPGVTGAGTFTIEVVADLNNQVNEGTTGEANNKYSITYTVIN
jgi:ABC-type branched-subunit amino acid transport system substrate-binding protein/uncharacterized protein YgiM (DUF1202 family)